MDDQWKEKAQQIKLVLTDCDGVLTDGGVYYSERGEEMKRFSLRDGMGTKRLALAGIETGIVTGEMSPSVARRAQKLGIEELHLGVRDKLTLVTSLLRRRELQWSEVAYIGDDVNDLAVLKVAGFSACPSDAEPPVKAVVDAVLETRGGYGAFREFAERILEAQQKGTDHEFV